MAWSARCRWRAISLFSLALLSVHLREIMKINWIFVFKSTHMEPNANRMTTGMAKTLPLFFFVTSSQAFAIRPNTNISPSSLSYKALATHFHRVLQLSGHAHWQLEDRPGSSQLALTPDPQLFPPPVGKGKRYRMWKPLSQASQVLTLGTWDKQDLQSHWRSIFSPVEWRQQWDLPYQDQ